MNHQCHHVACTSLRDGAVTFTGGRIFDFHCVGLIKCDGRNVQALLSCGHKHERLRYEATTFFLNSWYGVIVACSLQGRI